MDHLMTPEQSETLEHRLVWMRTLARAMMFLAAVLSVATIFAIGPRLEVVLSPVIRSFIITEIERSPDGAALVSGYLTKSSNRAHCVPLTVQAFTTDYTNPAKQVIIEFEPTGNPAQGWITRPVGAQEFGPWKLNPPKPPIGPVIEISVTHRCHALWPTTQILYSGPTERFFAERLGGGY